ncbi:MAG: glucose-6-phosphate isomerase [Neptuniibacter sp.]
MLVNQSPAWESLTDHAEALSSVHLADLLSQSAERFDKLSFSSGRLMLDLSKQRVTHETIEKLIELANQQDLQGWIEKLFTGEHVNNSEERSALHTALRTPLESPVHIDNHNIIEDVHCSLDKMAELIDKIQKGQWRGFDGSPIKDVVNIGVGGSDLGPLMSCRALSRFSSEASKHINMHFVSSMDGSQLAKLLDQLDPASTLFIISSKSFSTIDTLANAKTAREWLIHASGLTAEAISLHHFIGVTTKPEKALEWGIPLENQLLFWDWTGGRYSMWSVIGFPIALQIGIENFRKMLSGAHQMDQHFREASFNENIPVLLGLIGVWNINFLNIHGHAILPYDGRLAHLPAYLEQLEMESNGKNVTKQGEKLQYSTCPILWGEIGPNAQHAFYQLLHQGTESVMCDFIVSVQRYEGLGQDLQEQHQLALANCLAQSRLLALGDKVLEDSSDAPSHKRYHGNQPSTTIVLEQLTPETFGSLIAMYEHKVFVQSVIWEINPFDQWGVELGKQVATSLLDEFEQTSSQSNSLDCSTGGLLNHFKNTQLKY